MILSMSCSYGVAYDEPIWHLQFFDFSLGIVEQEHPNMLAILLGFVPYASINIIFSRSFMLRCLQVFMVTFLFAW